MRTREVIVTALIIVCGLPACSLITAPLPRGAELFSPPAVYVRWWAMTEKCSGRSGNLQAVHWYRVPSSYILVNGEPAAGYWGSRTNRIVLAEESVEKGHIVRHEMLHALLRTAGHPRPLFFGTCASLLDCPGKTCVKDAGVWQPPTRDFVLRPADSLDVTARVELLPAEADGQRWLALHVNVRNGSATAVLVAPPNDSEPAHTFGYDLRGPSGGIGGGRVSSDSSSSFFGPFATKEWLWEFRVAPDLSESHITPGNYIVRGLYARHTSADATVTVTP